MRAILFGSSGLGNAALRALLGAGVGVPVVVTSEDGLEYAGPHSLAYAAAEADCIVIDGADVEKSSKAFEQLKSVDADVLLVAGYGRNVSTHLAKLAKRAIYLHPSLLPTYRGPSAITWTLINGEKETGVTLSELVRQNDGGNVYYQETVKIATGMTHAALSEAVFTTAEKLVVRFIQACNDGEIITGIAQDTSLATMYPAVSRRDGHIRFDQGTIQILNRYRALNPKPGSYTDFCGVEYPILSIVAEPGARYDDEPGRVLQVDDVEKTMRVKSMDGVLKLHVEDELNRLGAIAKLNADVMFAGKITPFSSRNIEAGAVYDLEMPDEDELTKYLQFPDMVVLAVAYPCNAHCPNCPYIEENSDIRKKYADANFISPDLYMKISRECGEAGKNGWLPGNVGSMIRITGGGEPMLHPYGMTKLIEYSKSVGARVYLNTNGSLFKDDDIERLLACNVDNIEVSVDAADPVTYNVVRAGLDWDHVLASLRKLIDRRNATRSLTTIEVSVINQEIVSGKIPEIEKFWYDFGVDNVIVRKFLTWGSSTSIDPNSSADPLAYLDRDSGVPCPYPFHRLNVDSRGKVEVCGFDIMGRTNFGSLQEQTIRDIWKGAMFEWWRAKHREGRGGDIPLCAECPDWKYRSWQHNYRKALKDAGEKRDQAFAAQG